MCKRVGFGFDRRARLSPTNLDEQSKAGGNRPGNNQCQVRHPMLVRDRFLAYSIPLIRRRVPRMLAQTGSIPRETILRHVRDSRRSKSGSWPRAIAGFRDNRADGMDWSILVKLFWIINVFVVLALSIRTFTYFLYIYQTFIGKLKNVSNTPFDYVSQLC